MKVGQIRSNRNRLAHQRRRQLVLTRLMRHDAQQMQRVMVVRIFRDQLLAKVRCLLQLAGLLEGQRLLKLVPGILLIAHDRS